MAVETLTAIRLQNLKPPAAGVLELRDSMERGLCLRVFPSGHATWTLCFRTRDGSRRRLRLGSFPNLKLAEARRRAELERVRISGGADPQAERLAQRAAPTLGELCDRYLAEIAPKKKPATIALYEHYLRKLVTASLRARKANAVTREDIAQLHRELGKTRSVTANRVLVTISGAYSFGARHGLTPEGLNPARGIEKFREEGRERYLSGEEIAKLGAVLRLGESEEGLAWPAVNGRSPRKHGRKLDDRRSQLSPFVTAAFRLLLFTGCRLREILHLRWKEVDLERGLLLLPDSKTGRKPVVLNAAALQVLASVPKIGGGEYVIVGDSLKKPRRDLKRPWDLIRHHAGLNDVRIHDLRHTHASVGAGAGLGLPIIGALLGHKHHDTTQRYAHLDNDPLRRASERIGTHLATALGEEVRPSAEIVNIRAARHD
jgi:integrase